MEKTNLAWFDLVDVLAWAVATTTTTTITTTNTLAPAIMKKQSRPGTNHNMHLGSVYNHPTITTASTPASHMSLRLEFAQAIREAM